MNTPGWRLHPLSDDLKRHWAVLVNGNWRMTFTFEGTDAVLTDDMDYRYRPRSVKPLRPYLAQFEVHILEQAWMTFDSKAEPGKVRVVS